MGTRLAVARWLAACGILALAAGTVEARWTRASTRCRTRPSRPWRRDRTGVAPADCRTTTRTGGWNLAHVRSALGRLHQVQWLDAGRAEAARRHLLEHLEEVRRRP